MSSRTQTLLLCAAFALFGAGCASASAKSTPPTTPPLVAAATSVPACELFLKSDAEKIFGGLIATQENPKLPPAPTPRSQCTYRIHGTKPQDAQSAIIVLRESPTTDEAIRLFAQNKKVMSVRMRTTIQDISGLGDEAFWGGPKLNQLIVRAGTRILTLSVSSAKNSKKTPAEQLKLSQDAMAEILGRLKK